MMIVGGAPPAGPSSRIVAIAAGNARPTPVGAHPVRELFLARDKGIAHGVRSYSRGGGHA